MRLHFGCEIVLILNDAGNHQLDPHALRHVDRFAHALMRMDPTKEQQILSLGFKKGKLRNINTVMDGGYVVQLRRLIRLADRYVVALSIVFFIDRYDRWR